MTTRQDLIDYCVLNYDSCVVAIDTSMVSFAPKVVVPKYFHYGDAEAYHHLAYCALQFKFWHDDTGLFVKTSSESLSKCIRDYFLPNSLTRSRHDVPDSYWPWGKKDLETKAKPVLKELSSRRFSMKKLLSLSVWSGHGTDGAIHYLERCFPFSFGGDPLHKKAQLALVEMVHPLQRRQFTGLADYRLPQLLRHFKVLHYGKNLAATIREQRLPSLSDVAAIRSAAVLAMELIAKHQGVDPIDVDMCYFLRRHQYKDMTPFHLHNTTWY